MLTLDFLSFPGFFRLATAQVELKEFHSATLTIRKALAIERGTWRAGWLWL